MIESNRMSAILRKLHREVLVLNTIDPVHELPPLDPFRAERLAEHELQVEIHGGQDLNMLFARLSDAGIRIYSMRNRANRLEEVFFRLTERGAHERQGRT